MLGLFPFQNGGFRAAVALAVTIFFFFCQSASSSRKTPGRERSEHAAVYYDDWKSSVNTQISAEKRRKSTVSFRTISMLLVFPRVLFGILIHASCWVAFTNTERPMTMTTGRRE